MIAATLVAMTTDTNPTPGFDLTASFRSDLPDPAPTWSEPPRFSFVGGHNDAPSVPFAGLAEAAVNALTRDGRHLATYNLGGAPLGLRPLREFVADALERRAGMACDPDEILIVSGSLQALDLVNGALVAPGDTVVVEQATYGGMVSRLQRAGARIVGVELDDEGIVPDRLESVLSTLADEGVRPKYVYTIPTIQNPTGSVMPIERRRALLELSDRFGVPIFEDDCYADLVWDGERPPTIRSLDREVGGGGHVVYCGSFSKSIAPALRVGYIVADRAVIQQLLALKTDAGTGAIEQLTLAEYAPSHFDDHVEQLKRSLQAKCEVMVDSIRAEFGEAVTVMPPKGGIYVWVTFPDGIDTGALAPPRGRGRHRVQPGGRMVGRSGVGGPAPPPVFRPRRRRHHPGRGEGAGRGGGGRDRAEPAHPLTSVVPVIGRSASVRGPAQVGTTSKVTARSTPSSRPACSAADRSHESASKWGSPRASM